MARLPFPDYNTQSYYVSRSFATLDGLSGPNCKKNVKGQTCWTGIARDITAKDGTKIHQYDSVCVNDSPNADMCEFARTAFCKKNNCGGNQIDGKGQGPTAEPVGGSTSLTKAVLGGDKNPVANTVNNFLNSVTGVSENGSSGGGGGQCDKDPATGCCNCGADWYNPAQWACQFQKLGCEMGHGFGNFGQYLPYIAIGGAAILLIVLIKR